MEGETRERAVRGRKVIGSVEHMMKVWTVDLEVKNVLCDEIIVPTITSASETWAWNESQRSRIQAVELSNLRRDYGGRRMDGVSNESVYYRYQYDMYI